MLIKKACIPWRVWGFMLELPWLSLDSAASKMELSRMAFVESCTEVWVADQSRSPNDQSSFGTWAEVFPAGTGTSVLPIRVWNVCFQGSPWFMEGTQMSHKAVGDRYPGACSPAGGPGHSPHSL